MLKDVTASRAFTLSLLISSTSPSASFVPASFSLRFSSSAEDSLQTSTLHSEVPSALFMHSQSDFLMQILSVTQSAHISLTTQSESSTLFCHCDLCSMSETMQMTEIMSEILSIESVLSSLFRTRETSAILELSDDEILSIEEHEEDVIYENDQAVKTVKNTK